MTHQYESEILNKLMERDGFNIPSSVPPYEAEIKAYLINQVKQAYPKLTDYEAEWLLYNYTKHLPADFPISSVSNVTEASFENVVPFAYQSAILKGQTLVNVSGEPIVNLVINSSSPKYLRKHILKKDTVYTFIYDIEEVTGDVSGCWARFNYTDGSFKNVLDKVYTTGTTKVVTSFDKDLQSIYIGWIRNHAVGQSVKFKSVMILEGDWTDKELPPYFDGMASCKMPVLTTTGKNLFDGELEKGGLHINSGLPVNHQDDRYRSKNYTKVQSSTKYVLYNNYSSEMGIREYDEDYNCISKSTLQSSSMFTTSNNTKYLKFIVINTNDDILVQLEQSEVPTSYEPFKSNILTVNEPIELRGIGDVQDELDLLTGELTRRIGEVVFDGSENWEILYHNNTNMKRYSLNGITFPFNNYQEITNHFRTGKSFWNIDETGMYIGANGKIVITFQSTDNRYNYTLNEFKNYLSENPIKLQYPNEESVKTVDLKTVNESGESVHFMPIEGTMNVQSSGEIIQPTFDMAVPVEATTQNLASFIDLEMEE